MGADRIGEKRARVQALAEPMRSVALEQLRRLQEEGRDEEEALDVAVATAEEWKASRAPNRSAQAGDTGAERDGATRRGSLRR
jgi:hypothetical protein